MKIKIHPADTWTSKCIREGSNQTCERCGGKTGLQCCHYQGRGAWETRFLPLNLFCLCMGCHSYLDGHKIQFKEFFIRKRGQFAYDVLVEKCHDPMIGKQNRREVKEIAAHYKAEYERIMKLRSEGETRRIEVVGY